MPDRFQVHADTVDGGSKVSCSSGDVPGNPDSDGRVFIQLDTISTCTPNSTAYRNYTAWIAAKNAFGESNSTGEIPFSKFVYVTASKSCDCIFVAANSWVSYS